MALYFLDFRSKNTFSKDDEGVELPDAEAAHNMALDALFDAARGSVAEGAVDQQYVVEVRNGVGRVLEVGATFYSKIFRKQ